MNNRSSFGAPSTGRPRSAEIPEHLIDPQTGTLRFCPASVDYLADRLEAAPDDLVKTALRGLEPLFEQIFQNLNFSCVSFIADDLKGMNFSGARFVGAQFEEAAISGAVFRGAEVDRRALMQASDWPEAVAQSLDMSFQTMGTTRRSPPMTAPRHGPWAIFSEAHHLPELILLPPDLPVDDLPDDAELALREGRLSIGRQPVSGLEMCVLLPEARAVDRIRAGWEKIQAEDSAQSHHVSGLAPARTGLDPVKDYLELLNQMAYPKYTVPSAGLLQAVYNAARTSKAPVRFPHNREFALDGRGRWQVATLGVGAVPAEPSISFDEHAFRVLRIFERSPR